MAPNEFTAQGINGGICFADPRSAVELIVSLVSDKAKETLLDAAVSAWAHEVPAEELGVHYEKAARGLDEADVASLADWHSDEVMQRRVIPSSDFLIKLFPTLGESRRAALELAAGLRMHAAIYDEELTAAQCLETTVPLLSAQGMMEVATTAAELYMREHAGSAN